MVHRLKTTGALGTVIVFATFLSSFVVATAAPARAAAAAATDAHNPIGAIDGLSIRLGGVNDGVGGNLWVLSGWAGDPDIVQSNSYGVYLQVAVFVDGTYRQASAGRERPDVRAAFPKLGPDTGFSVDLHQDMRGHTVCAVALNAGLGDANTSLGCRSVPAYGTDGGAPLTSLDATTPRGGAVRLQGWAADPDDPGAGVTIRIYLDGVAMAAITSGQDRPDVAAAFGRYGKSGFDVVFPLHPGPHQLCLFAGNTGNAGFENSTIGCRNVLVPGAPTGADAGHGSYDSSWTFYRSTWFNTATFTGWAFDPRVPGPWVVIVRAIIFYRGYGSNSLVSTGARTEQPRPDVAAAFPEAGPRSGWTATWEFSKYSGTPDGPRYSCAYVLGPNGSETFIGCRP